MQKPTYMDLQLQPSAERERERRSRELIEGAARHLVHSAEIVAAESRDYKKLLREALAAIRLAYESLLEWHDVVLPRDVPLWELTAPAENLASMLRTSRDRALHLEALQQTMTDAAPLPLPAREQVEMSYYTARNTMMIVVSALPERLTREASRSIERAHTIVARRDGRTLHPETNV